MTFPASSNLPSTMRTIQHRQKPFSLSIVETPLPVHGPDQLLIRVQATAVCARELHWPREQNISVPGVDVLGTVISAPSTSAFPPGSLVYARTTFPREGAGREYTIAEEHELALAPQNIPAAEAAAVPLSALTAWQALFQWGELKEPDIQKSTPGFNSGKRVLVSGASGGVGNWGVQLAKLAGAHVVATCGPRNAEFVKELGADEVLDYSSVSIAEWVASDERNRIYLVLDCVGGEVLGESWAALDKGGLVLSIVLVGPFKWYEDLTPSTEVAEGVRGIFFIMKPNGDQLGKITRLIEQDRARGVVDSVWRFEEWAKPSSWLAARSEMSMTR